MASFGMGHATRSIPIIDRMEKEYEVHIFTARKAKNWLGKRYKNLHQGLAIPAVRVNGKVNIFLTNLNGWLNLPRTIFLILKMLFFIIKHRPIAVFSDFDLHGIIAGRLASFIYKVPIIASDNFMSLLYSEIPFELTEEETSDLKRWQKNVRLVTSKADHYLVHKFLETSISHPKAEYVPIPIREEFLEASKNITYDGPIVVSTGSHDDKELIDILKKTPFQYMYFGHLGDNKDENIEFCSFSEDSYLKALQAAPFVIVSGNSSAIDALALKKPIMNFPHKGQFEQFFCAKSYEYLGVGYLGNNLSPKDLIEFHANLESYKQKVNELNYFDNDGLYKIITNYINEGQ